MEFNPFEALVRDFERIRKALEGTLSETAFSSPKYPKRVEPASTASAFIRDASLAAYKAYEESRKALETQQPCSPLIYQQIETDRAALRDLSYISVEIHGEPNRSIRQEYLPKVEKFLDNIVRLLHKVDEDVVRGDREQAWEWTERIDGLYDDLEQLENAAAIEAYERLKSNAG